MVVALNPTSPHLLHSLINNNNDESLHHHRRIFSTLNQCKHMNELKTIHAHTLRTTFPHDPSTLFLYSRILHFSSFSDLHYAYRVFDQIENPTSFMWNTLIRACAHKVDRKGEGIEIYRKMLEQGSVHPDKHTFPFVLKSCAYLFAMFEGKQIHSQILKCGFGSDVYVNNSLIHLYSSCGCLDLAQKVFDEMLDRSLVSWNVMIDALVQFGEFESALKLFRELQKSFDPDGYTIQSIINVCAGYGALSMGMWIHAFILKRCRIDTDVLIKNSLVEMYCKCGSIEMAKQVFDSMRKRDLASWNSMILGFASHGKADEAISCFSNMIRTESFNPNSITFVGVLSACNHRGLIEKGREYFERMVTDYDIQPVLEHYGCMIDLLARAGFIDEALDLISEMPMKPDVVIWRSLLDACSKNNASVELSEVVANQIIESDETISSGGGGGGGGGGVYVLLSRVYATATRWNDVGLIRKLMTDKGIAKEPGCSLIEIDGIAHELFAGDTSHPRTREIYRMLDEIDEKMELVGYSPDYKQAAMVDDVNESKKSSLKLHSERLAIALGLLNLKPGIPIRVFKNLRVCGDCHEVTKLISGIFDVEIIVRDRARFHHFRDGSCSCMDYW